MLADLETRMREAAADLNFEEAARLRDEVKRLRATELAVVDDPTVKAARACSGKAGAYAGTKKYGDAANLPASAMKKRGGGMRGAASSLPQRRCLCPPRPVLHGRGVGVRGANPRVVPAARATKVAQAASRRNARPTTIPALSAPSAPCPQKPFSAGTKQGHSAHRLPPVRPGVRPCAPLQRQAPGASGRVEAAVVVRVMQ